MANVTHLLIVAAIGASSLALAACDVNIHAHHREPRPVIVEQPVYQPERVVVVQQPPREYVTVVRQAPPPPHREVVPPAPGRDFVWIPGYWVSQGGRWVWVSGHWERPPRRGAHWEAHVWERRGDRFELRIGGWK